MAKRILFLITIFGLLAVSSLIAQEKLQKDWKPDKIKGTRFIPYPPYSGTPYFNEKFVLGEIELLDGTKIGNLGIRYSSFQDELIYYNTDIKTQIVIDKISLKGFSYPDELGTKRSFRRQNFDTYLQEERFFEVLSDGTISLLAFRKVDLETCDTSYSKFGLAYQPAHRYYAWSAEKGYSTLKISRSSLLSKFDKPRQRVVKRLLRKNDIQIVDEATFVQAWNLIIQNGLSINF